MNEFRRNTRPHWLQCSKCLAEIGIGITVASRLLRANKRQIHRAWKLEGIKAKLPECGEWRRYALVKGAFKSDPFEKHWWGNFSDYWMSEYNPRFFDWSCMAGIKKLDIWIYKYFKDEQELKERASIAKKNNAKSNRESSRKRKIIDPGFRVQCNLRHRLKEIMGRVKRGGTEHRNNLTGCTTRQLAKHLESTFKRGMNWDNYGTRWHVDHIIPCASFDQTDAKQRAQCWHWTNLRALEAKKNMEKSDTITEPQMSLLLCASH